jgi:hypothetical protein
VTPPTATGALPSSNASSCGRPQAGAIFLRIERLDAGDEFVADDIGVLELVDRRQVGSGDQVQEVCQTQASSAKSGATLSPLGITARRHSLSPLPPRAATMLNRKRSPIRAHTAAAA